MFKPSRNFYQKRRQRFQFQPLLLLLAIPVTLIALELLTRIIVTVAGKNAELAAYQGDTPIASAYRLKFIDQDQQPYDGLPSHGKLVAKRRVSVGYQLAGNQKSDFWQINSQGFRNEQLVPQTKPKDEIRVFVLGGSTAFGKMSSNNQTTFASKLEARLNQRVTQQRTSPEQFRPDPLPFYRPERIKALTLPPQIRSGKYRVINAAVPGYASGNELAALALQALAYQPDVIIVLDGYQDLILPSSENEADIPQSQAFLSNAPEHLKVYLTQQFNQWINQAYLVKATQYWLLAPQKSGSGTNEQSVALAGMLPDSSKELKQRSQRYQEHITQMARLTSPAQIPLIVAIQPEITGRDPKKLSLNERSLLQELGTTYSQKVQSGYTELSKSLQPVQKSFPKTVRVLNLYKLYNNFPSQAFYDAIHLTDEANTVLADRLYREILDLPELQIPKPKPPKE